MEKGKTGAVLGILLLSALLLYVIPDVHAAKVGIVVDLGSTTYTSCVAVRDGTNGYDILEKTSLSIDWSEKGPFGHALCKINGIGENVVGTACDWGSEYWNFYISTSAMNSWSYSPVGFDAGSECWNRDFTSYGGHYCAVDGDMIGLAHGSYNTQPPYYPFEQLCPQPLEITDINVEVNGKHDRGVDEDGGDFDVKPGDEVTITAEVENVLPDSINREIRDVILLVQGDNVGDEGIDEESDEVDLEAGDDDKLDVSFRVPYDAREKRYDLDVRIEGTDEDGETISIPVPVEMRVKRDKHEIKILRADTGKQSYDCESTAVLEAELVNLGEDDETLTLGVLLPDGSVIAQKETELDHDAEHPERISFTIPLSELSEGTTVVSLFADYEDGRESADVSITKNKCARSSSSSSEKESQSEKQNEKSSASGSRISESEFIVRTPSVQEQAVQSAYHGAGASSESSDDLLWTLAVVAIILLGVFVLAAGLIMMNGRGNRR